MNTLTIEKKKGYAIIQLDNGKVNAINTELARDLKQVFLDFEADETVKGIILTGRPHGFSAGLDVMEMATSDLETSKEFWRQYMSALRAMVHFSKPFICAITGYAPAGATILTLCADYRIMGQGPKHVVGMHEFKMSMLVPEMLCDIYAYYLGEKKAWSAVLERQLFNSDQAVEMGLVNESVAVEEVLPLAEKKMKQALQVLPAIFKENKKYLRKELNKIVDQDIEAKVEGFAHFIESNPELIEMTKMFMASLRK